MDTYEFAVAKVKEAGEMMLALRAAGFESGTKGGNARDIVTSVDTAISAFLVEEIKRAFPDHGIYSEEGGGVEGTGSTWALDPIDGSSNFARGIPSYCVCIGLIENGAPTVGAVYNPVTRELFSFKSGGGAFLNGVAIRVSTVATLAAAQVVMSPGSRKAELWDWAASAYRKLLEHTQKRAMLGSSALDLCFIACGRADVGIYGTLSALDVAGAVGILLEAGGAIADAQGNAPALKSAPQTLYMANSTPMLEQVRALLS